MLEAGPVSSLDTDAGMQAEPTAVIPGQHVLGFVGLEDAVPVKAQNELKPVNSCTR